MDTTTLIEKLDSEKDYSRRELYEYLCENVNGFSYNSFNWQMQKMLANGEVYRSGRNTYRIGRTYKRDYSPQYSEQSEIIIDFMEKFFPDTEYSIFETTMLNEFLNHQIAKNTIFLYVEKELSEFVFRDTESMSKRTVLYKPRKDDLRRYWKADSVIVLDRISEAPRGKAHKYDTPLEKVFVDMLSDQSLMYMFSKSEYPEALRIAYEKYHLDNNKMFRYARRRGKLPEIQSAMAEGGIEIDNT
ncbi:DUF6577 family protein [Butyrivibrio sp. FC2001]|uniref:DUF6577 family protein n=1 Tax=Butyrivibrio sp. FC2001 TaxID=1280671 RepID=UPI000686124C|nr:DUF6577 family protein [Butyrivibrio sp. FC2001]